MHKKYTKNVAKGIIVLSIAILPIATFAENVPNEQGKVHAKGSFEQRAHDKKDYKGITGTVSSIVGTTITLTNKAGVVYTVDSTNAQFPQKPIPETFANVLVGDELSVVGAVTGNTILAKRITNISFFKRNVFGGRVTAISGNMITIVDLKKTTFTIDATNAIFLNGNENVHIPASPAGISAKAKALTIADLKVGNMITAIGTQSGTTIVATKIEVRNASFFGKMHKMMKNPKSVHN